ncbi:MAG: penicillin acylase family protein [Aeromicrobium sp.]
MNNVGRVLIAAVTVMAVLLAGAAIGVISAIRKPIPDTSGAVSLAGLDGMVTISREAHGIPTITAGTAEDLFFAQGYVHAQDRFHEMDVRRHVAAGRLSELVGHRGDDVGRLTTALDLPGAAKKDHGRLPASARSALEAYARGVNAYIVGKSGSSLSLDYTAKTIIGRDYRPDPWTSLDSVGAADLLGWNLQSLTAELDRIAIARHMSWQRISDLYPGVTMADTLAAKSPEAFRSESAAAKVRRLREAIAAVPRVTGLPDATGTATWVEPDRAGGPVLTTNVASAISLPSPWYQVGLRCMHVTAACPYDVTGLSMSGLPGVVVGHNRTAGWGFGPRLSSDAELAVRHSRKPKDPVVAVLGGGASLVLRQHRDGDRSNVSGILALDRARDGTSVEDAADLLDMPFALVYADTVGDTGQVPHATEQPVEPAQRSPLADLLVPSLLPVEVSTPFAAEGKATLETWDRRMTAHTPGAAYFAAVWRNVLALTFHDELPQEQWPDGGARWMVVMRGLLAKPDASWWDNLATPSVREMRDDILREAMEDARDDLTRIRARDVRTWDWADIHGPMLRNPTLDGRLFQRGPVHLAGSGDTVEATSWDAELGYQAVTAPAARLVMRLGAPDTSRWILSTGASGHAFSDHYTDQVDLWAGERDIAWPFTPKAVKDAAHETLTLTSPTR